MTTDTLADGAGDIVEGMNFRRHGGDLLAGSAPAAGGMRIALETPPVGAELRQRVRDILLLQVQTRSPITYRSLADRMALSRPGAAVALQNALEQLIDEDGGEGRPLLAAVAVEELVPGLPADWFFRKAKSIGLFAGDPQGVEAFAFHAREFHRVARLHASSGRAGRMLEHS